MTPEHVLIGLLVGLLAGALSGALGIGGGVAMVPAMVLVMGLGQEAAQGTSLLVIIPTALSGAYSHYRAGLVRGRLPLWVGLTGALGAGLGAFLAVHAPADNLRRGFALFLLIVGVRALLGPRLRWPLGA